MTKYLIKAKMEVDGVVEKHDVIGALFGQTEGLLGNEFDLRNLQDKGRIGRIQVNIRVQGGKTLCEVFVPSNLDRVETALLAAMLETVDKVGPYDAKLVVTDIVDLRLEKLKKIMERATEILTIWGRERTPDVKELIRSIEDMLKVPEPISYGPEELPAGPDIDKSNTIIVVEGRADVINLLRYGINNAIALGGARKVPDTLKKLADEKTVVLLVDGDHGGDLILKEVLRTMKVDYIARAPPGKEVEELVGKELEEALAKKVDVFEYLEKLIKQGIKDAQALLSAQKKLRKLPEKAAPEEQAVTYTLPSKIVEDVKSLYGTLEGILYSADWAQIKRLPVHELVNELDGTEPGKIYAIVFDGIITPRLVEKAMNKDVKVLIGARMGGELKQIPPQLLVFTFNELPSGS